MNCASAESSVQLTRAQRAGLIRIRDGGPQAWTGGCRARSAHRQLFRRMVAAGYCTPAPHHLTDAGRAALEAK